MTHRCPSCAKSLPTFDAECPHCLGAARLRHRRLVDLRDEVRAVQSRISAQMSGLVEPLEVVQKLRVVSATLLEVAQDLKEATRVKGK
jgi:hypothetical protein